MKLLSKLLIIIGGILLTYALTMNPDLKNILNNDKQNYIILSGIILIIGIGLLLFDKQNKITNPQIKTQNSKIESTLSKFLPWIIAVVVIFGIYSWVKGINNTAVGYEQTINEAWGNVNTSYQRRNDLIGNLVNTVKGAADFEKSTLTAVIEARAKATSVTVDPTNITPEQLAAFNSAQSGVSSSLSKLLVSVERYPDLKANANFLKLQDELASTENQILTARTRFNEAVKPYNTHIKTFPNSIFAGMFGFKEKAYFQAVEGAEKPVEVKF